MNPVRVALNALAVASTSALVLACGRIGYDETHEDVADPVASGDANIGSDTSGGQTDAPGEVTRPDGADIDAASIDGERTDGATPSDVTPIDVASTEAGPPDVSTVDATQSDGAPNRDAPTTDAPGVPDAGTGFYLEAESGTLSGFTVKMDATASGARFIEPPSIAATQPGTALAVYTFQIATAGTYVIWGRIHSPDATHNRFTVRVDSGISYTWRISTGDVWYWDAFHDDINYDNPIRFALTAGRHQLFVSDLVDVVGLDRLYITANGDTPPGNDPRCDPPHSIFAGGSCARSCGSYARGTPNMTTCAACSGQPTMPAYDCAVCCFR